MRIPLGDGVTAMIPYPLSEDDFKLLLDSLNLWKRKLVKQGESDNEA